ncbi:MAG: hypothetical protein ABGZ24_05010 [Fuerstiella sp.]
MGWTTAFDSATFGAADVTSTTLFGNNMGSVFVGDGSQADGVAVGSRSGNTNVFAHDVALQGGLGTGADGRFAQLGFQVSDGIAQDGANLGAVPVVNGNITVHTTNDIIATGGSDSTSNYEFNYAQVGHVGADQNTSNAIQEIEAAATSNIRISAARHVTFSGGSAHGSYSQLGQGGLSALGDHSGTTTLDVAGNVTFSAGSGYGSYSQLGQGGFSARGNHRGTTILNVDGNVTFSGGTASFFAYSQLGQGGVFSIGSHDGTTTLNAGGNVTFTGGAGERAYSQLDGWRSILEIGPRNRLRRQSLRTVPLKVLSRHAV